MIFLRGWTVAGSLRTGADGTGSAAGWMGVITRIREGAGGAAGACGSLPGMTLRITLSNDDPIFSLMIRAHSSRSLMRLPPSCREKVRIIWRVPPVLAMTERVRIWSRIAFSPLSTFLIVAKGISFGGRRFFALSTRITRLLVRIPSNGIDLT
jgi:hypothetical protein